jgi:hypothetical protein
MDDIVWNECDLRDERLPEQSLAQEHDQFQPMMP